MAVSAAPVVAAVPLSMEELPLALLTVALMAATMVVAIALVAAVAVVVPSYRSLVSSGLAGHR